MCRSNWGAVTLCDTSLHCPCLFLIVLADDHDPLNLRPDTRPTGRVKPLEPPTNYFFCELTNLASIKQIFRIHFPRFEAWSALCLELVAEMNMPCHAEGQEDTERAAQRGQPPGSSAGMPARPPVPVGGGFVPAGLRCSRHGVPAQCPATCERRRDRPRPHGARPCPQHLQVRTLPRVTARPCRPRGFLALVPGCPGSTAPPATSAVSPSTS